VEIIFLVRLLKLKIFFGIMDLPIKGLFEIHITVDETEPFKLFQFCGARGCKLIYAITENNNKQMMISKFVNGTPTTTMEKMRKLEDLMKNIYGMTIKRSKIESMMFNDGITGDAVVPGTYWEFHAKILLGEMSLIELTAFCAKVSCEDVRVNWSVNICGSKVPLLTLRMHECARDSAIEKKDKILARLKFVGFHVDGQIQREYAIYDSNKELDANWL
jgi:hypothetical protein